jgi:hypothetical protein
MGAYVITAAALAVTLALFTREVRLFWRESINPKRRG